MQQIILGKSVKNKEVKGYSFGDSDSFNKTLIIGCIHGCEPQSKEVCEMYIEENKDKPFMDNSYLLIIPCLNPDGLELNTRTNANGVDLNRNFPSNTWRPVLKNEDKSPYYPGVSAGSEPETKIIIDLLKKNNFKKIISIHTNHFIQNPNPPMINFDGEDSMELAEKLGQVIHLPVHSDIGYSTPGSLGTWVGIELKKISITIELDDKKKSAELYKKHSALFEVCVGEI